jgi:5'-nucleotidase
MLSTTMETYTGQKVDLSHPDPATINIHDISWHLSRIPRFLGAIRSDNVYTVAQHSVLVLNRVRQVEPDADIHLKLTALLHDAHEAYIGDVIKPMGELLDLAQPLRRLKSRIQNAIWTGLLKEHRFSNQKFVPYIGPVIKDADQWARSYEAYHLMHSRGNWHPNSVPLDEEFIMRNVIVWTPHQAQRYFLNHYLDLTT